MHICNKYFFCVNTGLHVCSYLMFVMSSVPSAIHSVADNPLVAVLKVHSLLPLPAGLVVLVFIH